MLVGNVYRCCCKIKSYLQQHFSFLRRAIRGCRTSAFSGSSEADSCGKRDFWVRQTDLLGQPAFWTRFISVLCKLIMHESNKPDNPSWAARFCFRGWCSSPLFFLNTVLCRSSCLKQEREMPLSVSAAWQHRSEQKRKFFPNYGVSHPAG